MFWNLWGWGWGWGCEVIFTVWEVPICLWYGGWVERGRLRYCVWALQMVWECAGVNVLYCLGAGKMVWGR